MSKFLSHRLDDPAAWYGPTLESDKSWIYTLSKEDISELDKAIVKVQDKPVRQITRKDFPLTRLGERLMIIKEIVDKGLGVSLLRGLPVDHMTTDQTERALWGMGQYVGIPQPQDAARETLHHVRDTGVKVEADPNLRTYQTNAEQSFHNDGGDLVMLLCRRSAKFGGTSRMASALTIFNEIIKIEPELAMVLQEPFYFDARGQQLPGCPSIQKVPIFVWYANRLNVLHKRPYIELAQRFKEVPPMNERQVAALDLLDELCANPRIHFAFEMMPGDIQVASNFSILHARDAFQDFLDSDKKRHMIRLWLGLPFGRKLPKVFNGTREFGPLFDITGRMK